MKLVLCTKSIMSEHPLYSDAFKNPRIMFLSCPARKINHAKITFTVTVPLSNSRFSVYLYTVRQSLRDYHFTKHGSYGCIRLKFPTNLSNMCTNVAFKRPWPCNELQNGHMFLTRALLDKAKRLNWQGLYLAK